MSLGPRRALPILACSPVLDAERVLSANVFVALILRAVRVNHLCLTCQPGKSLFTLMRQFTSAIP
jgi:hypothetical protein